MKENLQGGSGAASIGGGRMTQAPQKNTLNQPIIGNEESPAKLVDHIDNKFTNDFYHVENEQNLKTPTQFLRNAPNGLQSNQ